MCKFLTTSTIVLSAMLYMSAPVQAQSADLDRAYEAIRAQETSSYNPSLYPDYLELAQKGHAKSQFWVAYFQHYKSPSEAARWYEKAATGGHDGAAHKLAKMYEEGHGVSRSKSQAIHWHERAATLGHPTSMGDIGGYYYRGDGVSKSYPKAAYWWKKGMDAGDEVSRHLFQTIQKTHPQAVDAYFPPSAGDVSSTSSMATVASISSGSRSGSPTVQDGMSAFDAGNYQTAREILIRHAENGDAGAQNLLGIIYLDGLGVPQDAYKAKPWFSKAADQGHAAAQYHMGHLFFYEHIFTTRDKNEVAKEYLSKAAAQGSQPAQNLLATIAKTRQRSVPVKKPPAYPQKTCGTRYEKRVGSSGYRSYYGCD